jgi:hypothetical protein
MLGRIIQRKKQSLSVIPGEVNILCIRMTVPSDLPQTMSGDDLIAFDQPSPSSKSTFISIWESEDSVCDMRGWSDNKAPELVKKLQASHDMRLEILPDHENGRGDLCTS